LPLCQEGLLPPLRRRVCPRREAHHAPLHESRHVCPCRGACLAGPALELPPGRPRAGARLAGGHAPEPAWPAAACPASGGRESALGLLAVPVARRKMEMIWRWRKESKRRKRLLQEGRGLRVSLVRSFWANQAHGVQSSNVWLPAPPQSQTLQMHFPLLAASPDMPETAISAEPATAHATVSLTNYVLVYN
jgi:hypothetical protein